jgi:hypothetical protein
VMKSLTCVVLALFISIPRLFSEVPRESRATNLSGLLRIGNLSSASLKINGRPSRWLKEGDAESGNHLIRINVEESLVVLRDPNNQLYELRLDPSTIQLTSPGTGDGQGTHIATKKLTPPAPDELKRALSRETVIYDVYPHPNYKSSIDRLDFEWIDSDANPMRKTPIYPTGKEVLKWRSKSDSEKQELLDLYRTCGWEMTVINSNKGVTMRGRKISRDQTSAPPR